MKTEPDNPRGGWLRDARSVLPQAVAQVDDPLREPRGHPCRRGLPRPCALLFQCLQVALIAVLTCLLASTPPSVRSPPETDPAAPVAASPPRPQSAAPS